MEVESKMASYGGRDLGAPSAFDLGSAGAWYGGPLVPPIATVISDFYLAKHRICTTRAASRKVVVTPSSYWIEEDDSCRTSTVKDEIPQ